MVNGVSGAHGVYVLWPVMVGKVQEWEHAMIQDHRMVDSPVQVYLVNSGIATHRPVQHQQPGAINR
jgi:hypothetical protein